METIKKAKETMTAKERVKRTFAFEKTDRVTIGYDTNPGIHHKLCMALGVADNDLLTLYQKLGVDYVGANSPYVGKQIYPDLPNRIRNAENGAVGIPHGYNRLASTLSVSRASLYRVMDELEREGRIAREGKRILIKEVNHKEMEGREQ